MKKIRTTWGKVFEKSKMMLFNEYPNIAIKCGAEEELYNFYNSDDTNDEDYDEIYQWYLVDDDIEWFERFCPEIAADMHYSETIGHIILAVRHFGTGWDAVPTELVIKSDDEDLYEFYKKIYHDDLPDWVKKDVLNEKKEK